MPPWDLVDKPVAYIEMAMIAEDAEAYAQEIHLKRRERRNR